MGFGLMLFLFMNSTTVSAFFFVGGGVDAVGGGGVNVVGGGGVALCSGAI